MNNFLTNSLPVADWVENFTSWLTSTFSGLFSVLQSIGQFIMDGMTALLTGIPALLFIVILTIAAFMISNKKWGLTFFTLIGLLFIYNQGLWPDLMSTITLVVLSSVISIIIGVPLGIWMAKSDRAKSIITPILDFMQTMPGFVYLIPAVAFFGIGMVPGVFASVIFALPPTVRFTNLGIRQIPTELVEASDSFGGTAKQKLFKLELPLAKGTILAGINQTTMLALSMVVTASMIGAPGLGRGVLSALQRSQVGNGFVNGLALVILAIIIDRFTQNLNRPKTEKSAQPMSKKKKAGILAMAAVLIVSSIGGVVYNNAQNTSKGTVNLAYVEWDSEVASTNVIAQVLRDQGYTVNATPLDNSVMWESVANGESDALVSAWLPTTHASQYEKYKENLVDLGPNLEGAKTGLVVPEYMDVNSISDLTDQAGQTITGIEPGAGIMNSTEKALSDYSNLSSWSLESSSSGAMTTALAQAINNQQEIIVTGWTPHWMFQEYDLKYLEDPEGSFGDVESIHTMTRKGLEEDNKEVYDILDKFDWTTDDMESVMLAVRDGKDPQAAAQDWIKANSDKVAEWTK
ncbi:MULTISPECIES: ABC transporter permease/substrate binding protein [Enterococcus]|uniref:ABC transporter permease/substrate binding protein n=1 Tax=Enterococcus alishanensis TaxID=1303817 RepID=A0ABS6TEZ6_9ENTE|nr:ABC transporter permease/substrate binding protein [Enterococcus alishanensis]MBV7391475.1 ABC transporter permease/substrate binding protein [Enterococcus alishanensis]